MQGEKFLEIRQGKDIEKVFWEKKCVVVGKSPYSANFFGIVEYWEREKPTWDFFQFYSDLGESRKKYNNVECDIMLTVSLSLTKGLLNFTERVSGSAAAVHKKMY